MWNNHCSYQLERSSLRVNGWPELQSIIYQSCHPLRDSYLMVQVNTSFHIVHVPVKKVWNMEKQLLVGVLLLSSPQLKPQVVFSDCLLSVIHLSENSHIFDSF